MITNGTNGNQSEYLKFVLFAALDKIKIVIIFLVENSGKRGEFLWQGN